jgi:DNA mismatch endonuclease (patch repair protein)
MDRISEERRSYNMRQIKSANTGVELRLRRLLHGMGYRYRLHDRKLPGSPDIVFRKRRKVIFVHGCFWHQHPDANCVDSRIPKSRPDYWVPKLKRTQARDLSNQHHLVEIGWTYLIVWECELRDIDLLVERVKLFLD